MREITEEVVSAKYPAHHQLEILEGRARNRDAISVEIGVYDLATLREEFLAVVAENEDKGN